MNRGNNNLEKLHLVQVEILDEIVRICDKHNLTYFLVYGTLLGAVRHGYFIPWDDDLDIGMPRKDYDKFIEIAKTELNDKYYLQDISTDDKYWQNFLKIRKNNTLFDETMLENIETHKGIFVDIFPFDNLKSDGFFFNIKWSILKNLFNFCLYYRGIYKKEYVNHFNFCKIFSIFKMKNILKFCYKYMKSSENKETKYFAEFASEEKVFYNKEWILPVKEIKFGDKIYNCPNNNDMFLKTLYGDYMKLPPVEKRVTHLPKKIIFNTKEEENE